MSMEDGKADKRELSRSPFPLGAAHVLAHCGGVVDAFGRPLGFMIIMMALVPGVAVGVGTVVTLARALGRYL